MRFVTGEQIRSRVTPSDLIEAMAEAFRAYARNESPAPERMDCYVAGGEFHVKGGLSAGCYAVKANSAFFGNPPERPAIQGVVVAYDATTGEPLAVLESSSVTALRTAATSAVAARELAVDDARVLGLVGAGAQAYSHVRALTAVRPLERVLVWSRDPRSRQALVDRLRRDAGIGADVAASPAEAVGDAQIVVTSTPARSPLLTAEDLRPGTFVAAVGADSPHKQELSVDLVAAAALVCDLTPQCLAAGELHHAVAAGAMSAQDVRAELGAVLLGTADGRRSPDEIVVFDSTGTGFQDAAAAAHILAAG